MPNREKGVESVVCPTCGNELVVSEQLDGGVAAETCATCYPAEAQDQPQVETASAVPAPRERGTRVSEEKSNG